MAPAGDAPDLDVAAVGNALVDVLTHADDGFLTLHGLTKGAMTLIDAEQAERLYAAMGPGVAISGGSGANTAVGVASLGGAAAFVGRVRDDQLGSVFAHDIEAAGVAYPVPRAAAGAQTGRCLIVVTPDAERTMSTYLGASVELEPGDLPDGLVERAAITFLEGYLWDPPGARATLRAAIERCRSAGRRVAFTLCDALLVGRHRGDFRSLIDGGGIDVLFANEHEIAALYESPFDDALAAVRGRCEIAVLTRSERGSVVVTADDVHQIPVHPTDVVDATGAGDLYAAGFLYGLTRNLELPACGRLGALAAAEVLSHLGARPERPLADLAAPLLAP